MLLLILNLHLKKSRNRTLINDFHSAFCQEVPTRSKTDECLDLLLLLLISFLIVVAILNHFILPLDLEEEVNLL